MTDDAGNVKTETHGQDLTKGDVRKQLWSLAWPIMLSIFFFTLYNIVDAFWVSKISAEAIAAVSISQIALFIMVSLSMGVTVGSGVIMSMHIGAKDTEGAERVLGQSFVLSGLLGIFFTIISLVFRHELLVASGASGLVYAPALEYFVITAAGSILLFIMMTIVFAFNSQGDSFTPTKLFALSTVVNCVLDPLLIFGWGVFPELGIGGAAYATLISQAVFIVISLRLLSSENQMIRFRFRNLRYQWASVKKVLHIGIPASLTQVINPIGIAALMYITSLSFFEPGTIAFSIGFRIEFFAYLPAVGFGFASMALIGQNIGAGNFTRAYDAFRKALLYGIAAAIGFGILAILFSEKITHIFTTDALVTEYVLAYITIVALSYGFLAASMVEVNAFQAIGKSWPGFWLFILKFIIITVPLAYVLTRIYELPIWGVWSALASGNIITALLGYFWVTREMRKVTLGEVPVHATPPSIS